MKNTYITKSLFKYSKNYGVVLFCLGFSLCLHAQTYYVKPGGAGAGATWATAGDLQTIINAAPVGSQIWLKAGTYYPAAYPLASTGGSSNRDFAFTLKTGVAIYGGFAGTETLLSQRNPTTNVTILSGDVGTLGTYTDDCYHVLLSVGNTSTAVLDGLTIKYGYANGAGNISYGGQTLNQNFGGGIFCYNSTPVIRNCIFNNNFAVTGGGVYNRNGGTAVFFGSCSFTSNTASSASDGGGAAYNYSSSALSFDTCTFTSNKATGQNGGAAYGNSTSNFIFDTCTFTSNTAAADGGALYANNSVTMTITNSAFNTNTAAGSGGAIVTMSSSATSATNCTFTGNIANSATLGGGAIYSYSTGGSTATNCTFTNNTAVKYGGAFYGNSGSGGLIMKRCVFVTNSAVYGAGMANTGGSAPTVNNCRFSNGTATYGGAVYNNVGSAIFAVDSFLNNTSTSTTGMGGGGVVNDAANCNYSHCLFYGNTTNGGDGAGQYDNGSAAPIDSSCVFEANLAQGASSNGGGLYRNSGNGKTLNCVFVDNSCKTKGGGYYNNLSSSTVENCTFYNNTAVTGAAIYEPAGDNAKYYSNMVWNNVPDGLAIGGGATGGLKIQYNNLQAIITPAGSINNNTAGTPTFYNASLYKGSNAKWGDLDDGLHLATGSVGTAVVPFPGNVMVDDITVGPRPYVANFANEGAYESPGNVVLPIQLLGFNAAFSTSDIVVMQWNVGLSKTLIYEVQRSANGTSFSTIGSIHGLSSESVYKYTDEHANEAVLYYRLKLVSENNISYSPVVIVRTTRSAGRLSIDPATINSEVVHLVISGVPVSANLSVTIADASGRVLLTKMIPVEKGNNSVMLGIGQARRGLYFIQAADAIGVYKTLPFSRN